MAETDTLPPAGFGADVPHPPIGFSIDVPDHWTVLDLDPATWDVWLDAFLGQRLVTGAAEAVQERVSIRKELVRVLQGLQTEGVFLAAILAADVGGELVSASANLAWRKLETHGEGIPLAGLREVYVRAPRKAGEDLARRRVDIVELPAGGAVKLVSRRPMRLHPMSGPGVLHVTQYFVPVLATDWLAVITTSTGHAALAPNLEEVADAMARSLCFVD